MLNLTCVVTGHVTAAAHIHWFRGPELLNTAARGGVNILSDKVCTCRGDDSLIYNIDEEEKHKFSFFCFSFFSGYQSCCLMF